MAFLETSSALPGVSLIIESLDEGRLVFVFWFHSLCLFLGTCSRRSGEEFREADNLGLDLGTLTARTSNSVVTVSPSDSFKVELVVEVLVLDRVDLLLLGLVTTVS